MKKYCVDCGRECQGKRCWDCHCKNKSEKARQIKESRLPGQVGDDFVICPICGGKLLRITWKHTWFKHGLKWEKFKDLYPEVPTICDVSSYKTSDTLYQRWDEEAREAYSTLIKEYWQEGGRYRSKEYIEAHLEGVMRRVERWKEEGVYDSDSDWIKNLSEHTTRLWETGVYAREWSDERKEKLSKAKKQQWKDGIYDDVFNNPSNLELAFAEVLDEQGITYIQQYKVGGYLVDFLIENVLVVELNGDYWHNLPGARDRDKRRNKWIEKQGYPVLVFWETEFYNNPEECVRKVKESLN